MHEIRIGISGWTYPGWRKAFYPPKLAAKHELEYASSRVSTIEINGTFYHPQPPAVYRSWRERTPQNFKFSVKASRYITHIRRLNDVKTPVRDFCRDITHLKEKLGPVLWQFPPNMKFEEERFKNFFKILPKTLRHAVEIRNDSFRDERYIALLRKYNVAYVIADTADRWIYAEDLTSDLVYIRLHGFKELYSGGYPERALDTWAARIKKWRRGASATRPQLIAPPAKAAPKDVFIYFDNDAKVNAPFDAAALTLKLARQKGLVFPAENPHDLLERKKDISPRRLKALQERAQNR